MARAARRSGYWNVPSYALHCIHGFLFILLFSCSVPYVAIYLDFSLLCVFTGFSYLQTVVTFITHWVGVLTLLHAPCVQIQGSLRLSRSSFWEYRGSCTAFAAIDLLPPILSLYFRIIRLWIYHVLG